MARMLRLLAPFETIDYGPLADNEGGSGYGETPTKQQFGPTDTVCINDVAGPGPNVS